VRFRKLIAGLGQDTIVLFSTHIVSDVEKISDHMLMMSEGRIIFDEPWDKERTDLEQFYMREFGGEAI
jgi:ABC-2 type transport system ATP-binding protein